MVRTPKRHALAEEWLAWKRKSYEAPFHFLDFREGAGRVVSGEAPDEQDDPAGWTRSSGFSRNGCLVVPKVPGQGFSFTVYAHQGKLDLLKKLPSRLRGYRAWLPESAGIVVLIDTDGQDCRQQKVTLENAARQAGFLTRGSAGGDRFRSFQAFRQGLLELVGTG